MPAIEDPNTGITLWESNAILEYLLDTYDTEGKLGPKSGHEKHHMRQWLNFQTSGQVGVSLFNFFPDLFTRKSANR